MARRLRFNPAAPRLIMSNARVAEDIRRRTQAVVDACNSESSWGGYNSEVDTDGDRPVGRVWSIGKSDRPGGDRAFRLIKNLDRGR